MTIILPCDWSNVFFVKVNLQKKLSDSICQLLAFVVMVISLVVVGVDGVEYNIVTHMLEVKEYCRSFDDIDDDNYDDNDSYDDDDYVNDDYIHMSSSVPLAN